jgi:hypothetical protein
MIIHASSASLGHIVITRIRVAQSAILMPDALEGSKLLQGWDIGEVGMKARDLFNALMKRSA